MGDAARSLRADRIALGGAGILSVSLAAELLPIGEARARRWLRDRGLIRDLDGTSVVLWADVTAALSGQADPFAPCTRVLFDLGAAD